MVPRHETWRGVEVKEWTLSFSLAVVLVGYSRTLDGWAGKKKPPFSLAKDFSGNWSVFFRMMEKIEYFQHGKDTSILWKVDLCRDDSCSQPTRVGCRMKAQ